MAVVKYFKGTRLQYEAYINAGKIQELNFYYVSGSEKDPLDGSKHLFLGLVEISNSSVMEKIENQEVAIINLENSIYEIEKKVVGFSEALDSIVVNEVRPLEERLSKVEAEVVGGIRYKGSVPTVDDLPLNPKQGDLYEIEADGSEYCYNGEKWFEYGSSNFRPVESPTIAVDGKELSVKVAGGENALQVVEGGLFVEKCNFTATDRVALDNLAIKYATKTELSEAIQEMKESSVLVWEDMEAAPGTAKIGDNYYSTVKEAIAAAKEGDVIELLPGEFGVISFPVGAPANLTLQGGHGVKVKKVYFYNLNNEKKPCPEKLTLKNITFNGGGVEANNYAQVIDLSIVNCTFMNQSRVRMPKGATNLTITGCEFDAAGIEGDSSTIYLQLVNGFTVVNNTIKNSYWNAINVTTGSGMSGNVIIQNNIIKGCGSRAMRLVAAQNANIIISNNKISDVNRIPSEAEANAGEIIKVSGTVSNVSCENNTYNGKALVYENGIAKIN